MSDTIAVAEIPAGEPCVARFDRKIGEVVWIAWELEKAAPSAVVEELWMTRAQIFLLSVGSNTREIGSHGSDPSVFIAVIASRVTRTT
jgi:hypothetical protein